MSNEVVVKLDLSRYSPTEIIEFIEQDVVTVEEVIASGRVNTCFTSELADYLDEKTKKAGTLTRIVNRLKERV